MNPFSLLVVDDDENDLLFMRRAISRAEISNPVQVVRDGQQAIDYLAGTGSFADRIQFPLPGLIITDYQLPLKSGFDLLKWLRSRPGLKRIPVILLSSTANPAEMSAVFDAGGNAFVVKPTGMLELVDLFKAIKEFWINFNQVPPIPK
jgi:CheY-like chemotaxis protein